MFFQPGMARAAEDGKIVFSVVSTLNTDGSFTRAVSSPPDKANLDFAVSEFFGDKTGEIATKHHADGRVELSRTFSDLEDCVGVLMVTKDLYFCERFQIRQSIPQYFDEKKMKNVKVNFSFSLPESVIKIARDRKTLRRQFGRSIENEFTLDRPGNMDVFYQNINYGRTGAVVLFIIGLFAAAKAFRRYAALMVPVLSVVIAFIFAAITVYIIGESPISAMGAMYMGVFGSTTNFLNMLLAATPLIFTGLAVAFAFNCGLFNIGGEGQVMVGGFIAAMIGFKMQLPPFFHVTLAIVMAALASGAYASIAGWLRARFHVHEVISSIMLNYISYSLLGYLVLLPGIKEAGPNAQTCEISPSAFLPEFFARHDLNYGFILAIVTAVFTWFLLYKTTTGFNIRAVGLNESAAEYSGVNISKNIMLAMFVSGALAGIGGVERVLGVFHKYNGTAFVGYGFDGIAVALLVNNNPLGIIISSLLFGFLKTGGSFMNREIGVPVELVVIVQAVIIFFIAADKIVRNMLKIKE